MQNVDNSLIGKLPLSQQEVQNEFSLRVEEAMLLLEKYLQNLAKDQSIERSTKFIEIEQKLKEEIFTVNKKIKIIQNNSEKFDSEKLNPEKSHPRKPAQDKSAQDKSAQDKSEQDKSEQDKSEQDKSEQNKSEQNKSEQMIINKTNELLGKAYFILTLCTMVQNEFSIDHYKFAKIYLNYAIELGWQCEQSCKVAKLLFPFQQTEDLSHSIIKTHKKKISGDNSLFKKVLLNTSTKSLVRKKHEIKKHLNTKHCEIQMELPRLFTEFLNTFLCDHSEDQGNEVRAQNSPIGH